MGHRGFVGYLIVMAFSMGITFAYVATSAFILQSMNGLSPREEHWHGATPDRFMAIWRCRKPTITARW